MVFENISMLLQFTLNSYCPLSNAPTAKIAYDIAVKGIKNKI